jgi:hypothetical protein
MVPGAVFTTLCVFVAYKYAQKASVLHKTWVESLANNKHSNSLVQFVSYE